MRYIKKRKMNKRIIKRNNNIIGNMRWRVNKKKFKILKKIQKILKIKKIKKI